MNIDIRTLIIVITISSFLQTVALFLQYRVNKTYPGIGWWLLGFAAAAMGYGLLFLRDLIPIKMINIIFANALIVLEFIFIYVGTIRFLNKKENRSIVVLIFTVFILSFFYYTYFDDNITLRTMIVYSVVAAISLLNAYSLFFNKTRLITATVNFIAALFLFQGCFFTFRAVVTLTVDPVYGFFTPTVMQTVSFLFLFVQGTLLTFGLIIMVNQRLNRENSESKENLELIFNTSPDAVSVARWTEDYFVDINDGFTALTGYTRDEVIAKSSRDINIWQNPAERRQFIAALKEKGFCKNMEAVFRHKDGSQLAAMMSAKIITLQDIPHIICVTHDITERKRKEEEISRNVARLKSLVSILQQKQETIQEFLDYALAEAINVTGSKFGYIYFYNEERQEFVLNTWSKEVMKECTITDPQTIYQLENTGIWGEAVRQRQPILVNDYQKPHPLKKGYPQGHAHLRRFLTVPVMNGDIIVAVVGVANKDAEYGEMDVVQLTLLMDAVWKVTDRKQAEAALLASEVKNRQLQKTESLGRMAGAIAHNFNNQLAAVMGNLELALLELPKCSSVHKYVTSAMKASNTAAQMSGLMLTYLGQSFDKREQVHLSEVCCRNLSVLEGVMPENIVLEIDLPSPGPTVNTNTKYIQQVMINLVANAQEAIGTNRGAISLTVKTVSLDNIPQNNRFPVEWQPEGKSYACLEVTDTGCGIAENDVEKLFDPFYSSKFTGRGMGLAVVLGIVRVHGGVITVESKPERGSTFMIFFPLAEQEVALQTEK